MKLITAILGALFVSTVTAATALACDDGEAVRSALIEARQGTGKYHDIRRALADGYIRVSECVEAPGVGAMGYHYLNPALAADPAIDPRKPEVLLYAPKARGRLRLVGVEYFKADADQDTSTDDDRPALAGVVAFDGPMEGHSPGMPIHYDLHAWIWNRNRNGTFAQFNPDVRC
jgi:hypothetical protein